MYPQSIFFLAKISKKYHIFIEKLSSLQHSKNASFRNDIFQLLRSNHEDENLEQISERSLHIYNASDA